MSANTKEPKPQKSMICAQPGCDNPLPRSAQARRYAGALLDEDPFCSVECCRAWWGAELSPPDPRNRR